MRISDWSSDVCSSDLYQYFVPAAVRGMVGVASNLDLPLARYRRADAAADAAIGAGGADGLDHQAAAFSVLARQMRTRPASILTGTVGVQPLSSPNASPVESEIRQLFSGPANAPPWSTPSLRRPRFCGHRSRSQESLPSPARKTEPSSPPATHTALPPR